MKQYIPLSDRELREAYEKARQTDLTALAYVPRMVDEIEASRDQIRSLQRELENRRTSAA